MLLRGAELVHLDPPRVEVADIRVTDGRIAEVAAGIEPRPGESIHDLAGQWVIPGLVCAHTHLYSALSCGMPMPTEPPTSFSDMLAQVWWKLDEALSMDDVEISALCGGLSALQCGVTTLIDHHASPNAIAGSLETLDGALGAVGIRRVICYEVTDRGGPDRARSGLAAHAGLVGADGGSMRAVMVGAHANFTLSDATLTAVGAMAREAGVGVHIHVAEAADDAVVTGEDPVARMERLGALVPGSILAHCVHLDGDTIARIGDAGAWVTHQPRSNQNNGVGYAPVGSFGPSTALGTDGIGADMFAELQAGWFRAQEAHVGWSPERWLQALTSGARLASDKLGIPLGQIAAGAGADLVVLDPPPGPEIHAGNTASTFLFRLSSAAVRHVMVAGEFRLVDRCPSGVDAADVQARAATAARAIWARMV